MAGTIRGPSRRLRYALWQWMVLITASGVICAFPSIVFALVVCGWLVASVLIVVISVFLVAQSVHDWIIELSDDYAKR